MILYFILAGVICLPILYALTDFVRKIKLRKRFEGPYFDPTDIEYDFDSLNIIRKYWDSKNRYEIIENFIDDTTWNDLDMDFLFFRLNATQSSAGGEYLYAKLREICFNEKNLAKFAQIMDFMKNNKKTKIEALCALHSLGKDLYNNVHSYIFKINEQPIKDIHIFYILMILALLSIVSCFFSPAGFVFVMIMFILNTVVYYKNKFKLEVNLNSISYISKMVACAEKLSELEYGNLDYSAKLKAALKPVRKLNRLGASFFHKAASDLEALFEYAKIVLMWDFINYNRIIRILAGHKEEFHQIYELIGELDSAIAINEYRKTLDFYTAPIFTDSNDITCEGLFHPLLKNPVSNSLNLTNNAIITGSNASGKSTFIKALAITMICSQSIYLCFAKKYSAKMSCVMTSMAVKDKVYADESYFIAEIKSLKRILDSINSRFRTVCFIDEILKGTNTIERIASSAAILNWLKEKNCLIIVASHDIELTEMLKSSYDNYHFEEQVSDSGIIFDYKLYPGFAKTRNAINLLKFMGYDKEVIETANLLANNFEKNRKWQEL